MDRSQRYHLAETVGKRPEDLRAVSRAQISDKETNRVAAYSSNFEDRIIQSANDSQIRHVDQPVCGVHLQKPQFEDQKHGQHTKLLTRRETDAFKVKRCKSELLIL